MIKRISRSLSDVAAEVIQKLQAEHNIGPAELRKYCQRVQKMMKNRPMGGIEVPISVLWLDYEVQRDVIIKHIINLLKNWDNRICQPAACNTTPDLIELDGNANELIELNLLNSTNIVKIHRLYIYDAQHRTVVQAILGFKTIYTTIVVDSDPKFASHAFRQANTNTKKIGEPDKHRNALRLYNLGLYDDETIEARHLQDQFDRLGIDLLEEQKWENDPNSQKFNLSHFDYAKKPMGADPSGKTAGQILEAIITAWPNIQKINNGVYIGLNQMNEARKSKGIKLPDDWMTQVCINLTKSFNDPHIMASAAKRHAMWLSRSKTWAVPDNMHKFMRELYYLNGGKLVIPPGEANLNLDNGYWVDENLIPNHKDLFKVLKDDEVAAA